MGKPNFQRLAELGQLPSYIKPTVDEALAQVNAMNKDKKEEVKKEEVVKKETISLSNLSKKESKKSDEFVDDLLN